MHLNLVFDIIYYLFFHLNETGLCDEDQVKSLKLFEHFITLSLNI